MAIQDLIGNYTITGTNQNEKSTPYKGFLNLSIDSNNKILAEWTIGTNQKQYGTGFFHDNILVINFQYADEGSNIYKGVVVYKIINNNTLSGFWSEKHGDQQYLGKEIAVRKNVEYSTNIGVC